LLCCVDRATARANRESFPGNAISECLIDELKNEALERRCCCYDTKLSLLEGIVLGGREPVRTTSTSQNKQSDRFHLENIRQQHARVSNNRRIKKPAKYGNAMQCSRYGNIPPQFLSLHIQPAIDAFSIFSADDAGFWVRPLASISNVYSLHSDVVVQVRQTRRPSSP